MNPRHVISDHFSGGVFFVPLAPLDDPSLVTRAILQSLGYMETIDRGALEQIIDGIRDKQMLLVLDNFEHLMDGAAPLVSALLSACPRLKISSPAVKLCAFQASGFIPYPRFPSQKKSCPLHGHSFQVPCADALCRARCCAVRSDFSLTTSNIQIVASICTHLDGLPLAIELIAARIRLMSPQTLLKHLNEQFVLSASGMRADSVRQKTLHMPSAGVMPCSRLKNEVLSCLSVFAGGFTMGAVEVDIFTDFTVDL